MIQFSIDTGQIAFNVPVGPYYVLVGSENLPFTNSLSELVKPLRGANKDAR